MVARKNFCHIPTGGVPFGRLRRGKIQKKGNLLGKKNYPEPEDEEMKPLSI